MKKAIPILALGLTAAWGLAHFARARDRSTAAIGDASLASSSAMQRPHREHAARPSSRQPSSARTAALAAPSAARALVRWGAALDRTTEEAFAAEPADPNWNAASSLKPKLVDVLPDGSRIADIECRTTLCRVETEHVDEAHYTQYTQAFDIPPGASSDSVLWNGSSRFVSISVPSDDDEDVEHTLSVVYLAREGFKLPEAPPLPRDALVGASDIPSGTSGHDGAQP